MSSDRKDQAISVLLSSVVNDPDLQPVLHAIVGIADAIFKDAPINIAPNFVSFRVAHDAEELTGHQSRAYVVTVSRPGADAPEEVATKEKVRARRLEAERDLLEVDLLTARAAAAKARTDLKLLRAFLEAKHPDVLEAFGESSFAP